MPSSYKQDLARIGVESAARIAKSHQSCLVSSEHVCSSRQVIRRSHELLSATSIRSVREPSSSELFMDALPLAAT